MDVKLDSDRTNKEHDHEQKMSILTCGPFLFVSIQLFSFHSTVHEIHFNFVIYSFKFAYTLSEDQLVKLETDNTMTPTGCIQIEILEIEIPSFSNSVCNTL